MEIIQREVDEHHLFSQEWHFGNGWGLSVVDLAGSGPEIAIFREEDGEYRLLKWQAEESEILQSIAELYGKITETEIEWMFDYCGISRLHVLLDEANYWAKVLGRFPADYQDGILTFISPLGDRVQGRLDERSSNILCEYVNEDDDCKARDILCVLCDALQDSVV